MKPNLTELILETSRLYLVACSILLYEAILRHERDVAGYGGGSDGRLDRIRG